MRQRPIFSSVVLTVLVNAASISAQVATAPAAVPVIPPLRISGGVHLGSFKMSAVKGEPFSLISKTTNSKKLTDGTWATTALEEHRMRDSEGRERSEIVHPDHRSNAPTATINDPVAQMIVNLAPWNKTAYVTHIPLPKPPTPEQEARAEEAQAKAAEYRTLHPSPYESPLPSQTIAGVYAEGKQQTIVLRVKSSDGEPVRVVEDTWSSPDLKIRLASTSDDPRGQKIAMKVISLQRTEPDPALFQIPPDYKVVEQQN
jgi:hypothetical protein